MERQEVADLLQKMVMYYPTKMRIDDAGEMLNAWHAALAECDTRKVNKNLLRHVQASPFPPTISELAKNAMVINPPKEFVLDLTKGEDW